MLVALQPSLIPDIRILVIHDTAYYSSLPGSSTPKMMLPSSPKRLCPSALLCGRARAGEHVSRQAACMHDCGLCGHRLQPKVFFFVHSFGSPTYPFRAGRSKTKRLRRGCTCPTTRMIRCDSDVYVRINRNCSCSQQNVIGQHWPHVKAYSEALSARPSPNAVLYLQSSAVRLQRGAALVHLRLQNNG